MMQSVQKCSVGLGGFVLPHDSDSCFFIKRGTQDCLTFVGTRGAVCTGVTTSDLCRRLHPTVIPQRTRNCVNGFGSRQVCRASHDEQFKSPRSIALGLHRRYKDVVDGGFANLKEFVDNGVSAYAIGCTDEVMRKELLSVCELDCESVVSIPWVICTVEDKSNRRGGYVFWGACFSMKSSTCRQLAHPFLSAKSLGHVATSSSLSRTVDEVERVLCLDCKCILHWRHGMDAHQDLAAGAVGSSRSSRGTCSGGRPYALGVCHSGDCKPSVAIEEGWTFIIVRFETCILSIP